MSDSSWVAVGIALVLGFWMLGAHNRVVALRMALHQAWAQAEPLLRERLELLQGLQASVSDALTSETQTLATAREAAATLASAIAFAAARPAAADAAHAVARAEAALSPTQARLLALADGLPLPRPAGVDAAARRLRELDAAYGFARQRYNDAAQAYNDAIQQWPTRALVPVFRFDTAGTL
ncbi:MAG: LemA family protein [Aquabacterium sp.]